MLGKMKPRVSAFTQPGLPGAMLYEENEEVAKKEKKDPNIGKEGREAAKTACPFDEFCLVWIGSTSVDDVVAWLGKNGYSGEDTTAKARAKRIRKRTRRVEDKESGKFIEVPRKKFVDLPVLTGEATSASMNKIRDALEARNDKDGGRAARKALTEIMEERKS